MFKCKDDILLLPSYLAFSKEREEKTAAFETTDFIIENERTPSIAPCLSEWQVC